MSKIPTAEEFFRKYIGKQGVGEWFDRADNHYRDLKKHASNAVIEFAKLHVKAALEAAAEKAEIYTETYSHPDPEQWNKAIRKSSILNAYSIDNIG